MVTAAAALFEPAAPWACGPGRRGIEPESGRFRITIGPGVVRLGWTNPVRAEKAAERAVGHHQRDVDDAKLHVRNDLDLAAGDGDQAVVSSTRRSHTEHDQGRAGGVITEWSRKSRSAMCRTFAELDYSPLVESGRVPAMVTLTYPGDWEIVAPDGASVKRHMVLWRKRFQREYGEPARYIWKLEFQRRGAPHIHLWMAPPMSPGRSGRGFAQWLSETWAQVVDHPDPEQKARHRLAGTAIDVRNGLRACDPKRLAIYFTKHSSPNLNGDKEYQHIVPELWQQPGAGPGRFWGVYGLKKAHRRRGGRTGRVHRCSPDRAAVVTQPSGVRRFGRAASLRRWCRARQSALSRASTVKPASWSIGGFGDDERSAIRAAWPADTRS